MTVLEPGPGMGFFTLELLQRVGPIGRVIAVDMQPKMLERLQRRAQKAGLDARLDTRLAPIESMGIADLAGDVDFTLAFAVVHEFPSAANFFTEVAQASKPGARTLVSEPNGHVDTQEFEKEINAALAAGFRVKERLKLRGSHAVLLQKV